MTWDEVLYHLTTSNKIALQFFFFFFFLRNLTLDPDLKLVFLEKNFSAQKLLTSFHGKKMPHFIQSQTFVILNGRCVLILVRFTKSNFLLLLE